MTISRKALACLSLIAAALPGSLLAQTTLYTETFPAAADGPIETTGWVGHITRNDMLVVGQVVPANEGGSPSYLNAYKAAGAASAPADTSGNGFMLFVAGGYPQLVAWTEEVNFNLANYTGLSASWYSRNSSTVTTTQLVMRVDGAWYATAASTTHALDSSTWQLNSLSIDPTASLWLNLNFDGTTTTDATAMASVGAAPAADLSGQVTAFGFLFTGQASGSHNMRTDLVTITGTSVVPEPSTYALLGGIAALGYVIRRRRKA